METTFRDKRAGINKYIEARAKKVFLESVKNEPSHHFQTEIYTMAHHVAEQAGRGADREFISDVYQDHIRKLQQNAENLFIGDKFVDKAPVLKRPITNEQSVGGAISADQFLLDQENSAKSKNQIYGEGNLQRTNTIDLTATGKLYNPEEEVKKLHADS